MQDEIEIRVLEVDKIKMAQAIEKLGAVKIRDVKMKRINFDGIEQHTFLRLRDEGDKITLTFKKRVYTDTIEDTQEIEVEVSDFEKTKEILEQMGHSCKGDFQEQKRIEYQLDEIKFCIDTWPHIPTYLEIEAPTREALEKAIELLEVDRNKLCHYAGYKLFELYGHKKEDCRHLVFKEE
jgi:adenylate cyclase class 2